jgi:hypothetical protein
MTDGEAEKQAADPTGFWRNTNDNPMKSPMVIGLVSDL